MVQKLPAQLYGKVHMSYIEKLNDMGMKCSKYFQVGSEAIANRAFITFIDELDTVLSHYELNTNNHVLELINFMSDALAKKDYLFISDIISYELLPFISKNTKN